ncbi:MAG: transposase, partial [Chloroflexia bacterium]|nr:transposase [Chloroflexia bacterium]
MGTAIGIDIHKASLVVAVEDTSTWTVARTEAALTTLAIKLQTLRPAVIVLEPSGGYEQLVIEVLQRHQLPVARVHPRQVRAFIRGLGVQAKSDRLDARMLARFGTMTTPRLLPVPTLVQQRVAALSAWRRTLRAAIAAKTHQLQNQPAEVVASIERVIAGLETEYAAISKTIAALVATAPEWARTRAILASDRSPWPCCWPNCPSWGSARPETWRPWSGSPPSP